MKTPEEIAREIVEKWIESFSSHTSEVFLGDQLNLEEAIAQAITQERSRAKKLVEVLKKIERHELNRYVDRPEKREESEVFCIAFDALAEYERENTGMEISANVSEFVRRK